MFVGHYGPSYAVKALRPAIPLWILFMAVQLVDVAWSVLVLLGVEKVRIVPGITASNPLDLYYMPYTHSLVAALIWSVAATILVRLMAGVRDRASAGWVGAAVSRTGSSIGWFIDPISHFTTTP